MSYSKFDAGTISSNRVRYNEGLRTFMISIFNYMAMALAFTGVVAMFTASSPSVMAMLFGEHGAGLTGIGMVVVFSPIVIAFIFSGKLHSMSVQTAQILFWTYAGLTGMSLSSILVIYTGESIARAFFITASMFGAMAIYGHNTKRDLTALGSFLFMGVIGLIIAGVVNMFLKSAALSLFASAAGVVIFTVLTAYNVNNLKQFYNQYASSAEMMDIDQSGKAVANSSPLLQKVAISGALTLYLDFINIFLHILQFVGNRRN